MPEFWESTYRGNERMWGGNPTDNAPNVLKLLQDRDVKKVLIPGFGYGRNAKVFYEAGIEVTGIEISKTAIERARKNFGNNINIHHGSVIDMPFDDRKYDAVYCYSLLHLLNKPDRVKFIHDCYLQLEHNGIMIFVALSQNDKRFGLGEEIEKNTFLSQHGLNLFFYDEASLKEEFHKYRIIEAKEISEPEKNPTERHWMIICEK